MRRTFHCLAILLCICSSTFSFAQNQNTEQDKTAVLRRDNLVAWCIVPFDAAKRGPAERARMLSELGITKSAYDWRAEHVPTFEQEILEYQKHNIEFFAFWDAHEAAFALFEKHKLHPQIWQTLGDPGGDNSADNHGAKVEAAAQQKLALATRTKAMGCKLGLYNHGGWGGEPANMVAVCKRLRELGHDHVGIVYNFHHGHGHITDWPESLKIMLPYLHCLNLNGMNDAAQPKILGIGKGTHDVTMIRAILDSGYDGPIGILDHRDQLDARDSLLENRDGLEWVRKEIEKPGSGGPRPAELKSMHSKNKDPKPAPEISSGLRGHLLPGADAYRRPPLTVEVRATLDRRDQYNILVASDTKQSNDHWELFSMNGSGHLTAYLPGQQPDHVRSDAMICDGQPHTLAMTYELNRVKLYVDGRKVADQQIESRDGGARVPGALAIGRLVEGGLGCSGTIEWVRISKGLREIMAKPVTTASSDDATIGLWQFSQADQHPPDQHGVHQHQKHSGNSSMHVPARELPYDAELVTSLVRDSQRLGDVTRGAVVFSDAKVACLSCHRIGVHGGTVGPDLSAVAKDRQLAHIVESVFWPKREVKPEFTTWQILTVDGDFVTGYKADSTKQNVTLRDPASGKLTSIAMEDIDEEVIGSTVMPDGLTAAMTHQQQLDLIRFLSDLGRDGRPLSSELQHVIAHSQMHGPAKFDFTKAPLEPQLWPNSKHHLNRDRVYDFYTKQAEHFRQQHHLPMLLPASPGLDGGQHGHFGNQSEGDWASNRWNETDLGIVQAGVLHAKGLTIRRAVCVRLGDNHELSACFNPDTLAYDAVWSDGFVSFSSSRHGFLGGLQLQGTPQPRPEQKSPEQPFTYHGYYRHNDRIVFSYRIGDVEYLDSPWVVDGTLTREVAPAEQHSLRSIITGGPAQWPQILETKISPGNGHPFAIDTIELPIDNPWNALLFCSGHDFLPDGSALICTMQGDVWHVTGLDSGIDKPGIARWRRFASGLHQALGLVVADDGIYVQCRDQLTRLNDINGDGEADFYECFCNVFKTSAGGHDFICGLERDQQGYFYTASSNQGLVRMTPDGREAEVIATGFRNPDGLGIYPDGSLTVPCSEGDWTPASMICLMSEEKNSRSHLPGHFGSGGPRNNQPPELPLAYLPRAMDNSSGGQTVVPSETWGPLQEQLLHFSFGMGSWFTVLRDEVDGQSQGAVLPMAGDFLSGAHRGRFSERDNHLYVSGQQGWVSYTPDDGCFQRIRYTGEPFQIATGFHIHENGVRITFTQPVDPALVTKVSNHFAQCWNYRYSGAYGSPEYSPSHPGVQGHDPLRIASTHVMSDKRSIFVEIPDLQPVSQLHLRLHVNSDDEYAVCNAAGSGHDLFITVHRLDTPFQNFPGYTPVDKTIAAHPILTDMALNAVRVPNPWRQSVEGSRQVELRTAGNLNYATRELHAAASEPIAFTLVNPDVVPHNWVLVRPGTLRDVGELANQLIANPEAFARQYVPQSDDILCYTDIVGPGESQTIYIQTPSRPGRYPFLCTFPGHWMVMNGELIVE